VLALLASGCNDLDGPSLFSGGIRLEPQVGCYFRMEVLDAETREVDWTYDFDDVVCPGDSYETFGHEYGFYVVRLYRVDGEVFEVQIEIGNFWSVVTDA
jgi:hypothetical protein